jgi:hypothetical protein
MAKRKLTRKQIMAGFGGKRRKVSLRSNPKRRKRSVARKRRHTVRTRPNPPRKARRRAVARKSTRKRRNPTPMIISWAANPAKRRKNSMAKRRRATSRRRSNPAGRRRSSTRKIMRHARRRHSRRNPSLGNPMQWISNGAGVVAGVVGTRAIPQLVLGASNTGAMGYAANAATALGLGFLTHMLFPRQQNLSAFVVAGGFAGLISRVISDQTPFGAQVSLSGLGDWGLGLYQKSNYPYPPRVANGRGPGTSMFTWGDGTQAVSTFANSGADSMAAC